MEGDAAREEAEGRIRLFPGCDGIRVVRQDGEWLAVLNGLADGGQGAASADGGPEILVRRSTLALLVDFFEQRGGFAREEA